MLQPSSSLSLLQLSHVVTPCLLKAWRGRHVLGIAWLPAWAGIFAGVPTKGCMWGADPWRVFNKCVLTVSGSPADRAN